MSDEKEQRYIFPDTMAIREVMAIGLAAVNQITDEDFNRLVYLVSNGRLHECKTLGDVRYHVTFNGAKK